MCQQPVQCIPRQRLQGAVAFQARCAKFPQAGAVRALQRAEYDRLAEPPAQLRHAVDHPLGGIGQVGLLIDIVAAAAAAAGRGGMLAEIGQDRVAQAGGGAAVLLHRLQPLQIALVQQRGVLLL